ncbi:hypothetical protein CRENBAI_005516 [Crenichthys baileyi]|uniref:Uncharacterized protein n=1 Tax=Crenichthys baileyi TaxID=28760 RepID=A0AAV9S8E0_9TELE
MHFGQYVVQVEWTVRRTGLMGKYIDVDVFPVHYRFTRHPNKPVGWILKQTADGSQMRRVTFFQQATVYKSSSVQPPARAKVNKYHNVYPEASPQLASCGNELNKLEK